MAYFEEYALLVFDVEISQIPDEISTSVFKAQI
jgi:hypothetical protein